MEFIFEIILSFLLEFLGQGLIELIAELGVRSVGHSIGYTKPVNPFLAFIGYFVLASAFAGLSLLIFPNHLIVHPIFQIINLILTPLALGFFMSKRRSHMLKKGKTPIRLDTFAYGFIFAFTFSLIRYIYAK